MGMKDYVNKVNGIELGDIKSYEIGEMIGSGSFGKVYTVHRNGKRYAMKIPINANFDMRMPDLDDETITSFKKEALNWADVSDRCPDSVIVLKDYSTEPFPWMVMEFGETNFKRYLNDGKATVRDIIILLNKLQRIHDAGMIHRDIKPENIMLVDGEWKFTDFGLARTIGSMSQTMSGAGSAEYMAPEQWSPRKYGQPDPTTDLWAIGVILFRAVTGRSPYDSKDYMQMMSELMEYGPIVELAPEKYREILRTVFSFERNGRFQSADEFADALNDVENGRPLHKRRVVEKGEDFIGSGTQPVDGIATLSVSNDGICEYNGLTFRLKNSKLTLIKYSGLWDEVEIPARFMINDKTVPVIAVGDDVFRSSEIVFAVLPDTVVSIGDNAFADCRSLSIMVIPESVVTFGKDVLKGCTGLSKIGSSLSDLKDVRDSLPVLKRAGFSAADLKFAGISVEEMKDAGYSANSLWFAGYSVNELKDIGYPVTDLVIAGYSGKEIKDAGYSADELKAAGCNASYLKKAGYGIDELKDAGYTGGELKEAGCPARELKGLGYSAEDLRGAGYSARELKGLGYCAKELKETGYPAKELKDLGYSAKDLKHLGYCARELKDAGCHAKDLKDLGYSANDLKHLGYSAEELKEAGFGDLPL